MPMCFKSKYGKRTNRCRSFWKTPQETALTLPSFRNNSAKTTYRKPASQKPAFSFRTGTVSGKMFHWFLFLFPYSHPRIEKPKRNPPLFKNNCNFVIWN